jgi:hypothetical protein
MKRLLKLGFIKVGHWEIVDKELRYFLEPKYLDIKKVLYAFTSKGRVKYIGKTTQGLQYRIYNYQKPSDSNSTANNVNYEIFSLLSKGQRVDILVFVDNGKFKYRGYQLNLAAGLEDTLNDIINPSWNLIGTKKMR